MKKLALLLAIGCFIAAGFLMWFVPQAWTSIPKADAPNVNVTVKQGDDTAHIAQELKMRGVITSSWAFERYAAFDSTISRAKPGVYPLKFGMNFRSIARILAMGPERDEVSITIPEGKTLVQEAEIIAKQGVPVAQAMAATDPAKWKEDFPWIKELPLGSTLEGYLFPNTYRVWRDQLPEGLIKKQLEEFTKRYPDIEKEAKMQGKTVHEIITLASIVEREVAGDADRKTVAGIFWRRLREGMPLQSDATVNYVTKGGRARPTLNDLEAASPYNTYRNKGLPPGPISNPGDAAIDATLHPDDHGYRFFLTDDAGKAYYAKNFDEHKANRAKVYGE